VRASNKVPQSVSRATTAGVPRGGLTARHLRRISFREAPLRHCQALNAICYAIAVRHRRRQALERRERKDLQRVGDHLAAEQKRWERDLELSQVANLYVEVRRSGSRRPNIEAAIILKMTPAKVRDAVHQARNRGLLTRDHQKRRGAAKGELTDRATALLANTEQITSGKGLRALADQYGFGEVADSILKNEGRKVVQ